MATKAAQPIVYVWKGVDRQGRTTQGETSAPSPTVVKAQLRKQGIIAKSVKRKPKPLFGGGNKKITAADIAIFTRQLATMLKAGVKK